MDWTREDKAILTGLGVGFVALVLATAGALNWVLAEYGRRGG